MALTPRKRGAVKWLSLLATVAAAGIGAYELLHWMTHVHGFDARVRTDPARIASPVNGVIEAIHVAEGDRVRAGQPLVAMKADAVRRAIAALEAERASALARRARLAAEKAALEAGLEARAATGRERTRALRAERDALSARRDLARGTLERTEYLVSRDLASRAALDEARDRAMELAGEASVAAARVRVAEREVAEVEAGRARLAVLDEEVRIAELEARSLEARIEEREVGLADRFVESPIDGVIDRVFRREGEYVEDADEILVLHDPARVWIEAYIEEDRVRHLRAGQPVAVEFDALPFETFRGEVARVGMATVSGLAPDRAAGPKPGRTARRVPVRIDLPEPPPLAAPGMAVEIDIQIRDKSFLAEAFAR